MAVNLLWGISTTAFAASLRVCARTFHVPEVFEMRLLLLALLPVSSCAAFADSLWDHNGSVVRLEVSGAAHRIIYAVPRTGLPAQQGDLLFEGVRSGSSYTGTASLFSSTCGEVHYAVVGSVYSDENEIVLRGRAPRRGKDCSVKGYRDEELVFHLRVDSKQTTNIETETAPHPDGSKEVLEAKELLSAAFACPIPPTVRKEVSNGVMLFYNATTYIQKFEGDTERMSVRRTENFVQKSEPGLGGNFSSVTKYEYVVSFGDLRDIKLYHEHEGYGPLIRMSISCNQHRNCVADKSSGGKRVDEFEVRFCDQQTAKNAMMAMNILIRANAGKSKR